MFTYNHKILKFVKLFDKNFIRFKSYNTDFIFKKNSIINRYIQYSTISANPNTEKAMKEVNFDAITNGDKDLEHKLKVIQLEAEVMRQEGMWIPPDNFLTETHWRELLNLSSRAGRTKYLLYLFKLSKKKENRIEKKLQKRLMYEESKTFNQTINREETLEDFASKYDLLHNNLFLRVYESTMNQMYNNRLIQAIMFGQKLVVDCGFVDDMTIRENKSCAKQLMLLFAENRFSADPFDLHLCNASLNSTLIKQLHKCIPIMYESSFPLNIHECSYLDIFSKNELIYLTPHCREEVTEYNHEAVYIVGGIVDKVNNAPLSLAKAKKEGLKMAKFPLDKYLQWGSGSGKSLTLNQVISILNDVKVTGNWSHAFRHVPKRKLMDKNLGDNIISHSDDLSYDRPRRVSKWIPSANIDLKNLKHDWMHQNKDNDKKDFIKNIIK